MVPTALPHETDPDISKDRFSSIVPSIAYGSNSLSSSLSTIYRYHCHSF